VINFRFNIVNVPLSNNSYQKIENLIKWLYNRLFQKNSYITERYRPIIVNRVDKNLLDNTSDVAILMRGEVINNDEFTKNTLKMYRINYPKAPIYLSTWDYCIDNNLVSFLQNHNIKLIASKFKKPKVGYKNNNLQITGNEKGLELIIKDNIKYSLSTRTDQRLYSTNILLYLKNLISIYPYEKSSNRDHQVNRLVAMSFDTFMFRLYGLGDMFLFGLTKDVYNYWNNSKDTRIFKKDFYNKPQSLKSIAKLRLVEVYFMTEFLKRNGHDINWSFKDHLEVLKKRFIIIDSHSLDFFWPKYSFFEERYKDFEDIRYKEISHLDWLLIQKDKLKFDEKILDLKW